MSLPYAPPGDDTEPMRMCESCRGLRSATEFRRQRRTCKPCEAESARLRRAADPVKARDAVRRWRAEHRDIDRAIRAACERARPQLKVVRNDRWRKAHPERVALAARGRAVIYRATKNGTLERPSECENCGLQGARIEAAHHDYSKPLDVRWLCVPCHRRWDSAEPKTGLAS